MTPLVSEEQEGNLRKLLPCPFCGGPATAWETKHGSRCPSVWCRDTVTCGAEISFAGHPASPDARAAWNARAEQSS